jgi:hypothetical protein
LHRFIHLDHLTVSHEEIAEINHRPRRFGTSKYGVWRFVKGFLDLLTVKFLTGSASDRSTCSARSACSPSLSVTSA